MALVGDIRLNNNSKNLSNLKKRIQTLARNKIQTGIFQSAGDHPSGDSYVDIAKYQATKGRDLRPALFSGYLKSPTFLNYMSKNIKEYLIHGKDLKEKIEVVAVDITQHAKSLFGIPSQYNASNSELWANFKGGNTPLLFEGHLREAWGYKLNPKSSVKYVRGS